MMQPTTHATDGLMRGSATVPDGAANAPTEAQHDVRAQLPAWDLRDALRKLGNRGLIGGLRLAWGRFRWKTDPFRLLAPVDQHSDQAAVSDAIHWLSPVRIGGETQHALFMSPNSAITFHVQASPRSRIFAACGLLPAAWSTNRGGVEFELHVEIPELQWQARRVIHMSPGERRADRRWRPLAIRLPAAPAGSTISAVQVVVRLATRLPENASGTAAWSVWGEPRLEQPRTIEERRASVVGLMARVRRAGVGGAVRQIRELPEIDDHAARYRRWVILNTPTPLELMEMTARVTQFSWRPRISVLTPVYNTDPRWLRACIESVRRQAYPNWELCLADDGSTDKGTLEVLRKCLGDSRIRMLRLGANSGISAATNAALEIASGEFLAMLDHDDELAPEALFEVASLLDRAPDADFIYSDEDKLDGAGDRCDPHFKPDWSPEHFRSTMYTCHLMVLRADLLRALGGFRPGFEGAQDYDLALRVSERTTRIHHIPKVLYHWRKIPGSAATSGTAKVWAIDAGARALQEHVARSGFDAEVVLGAAPGLYRMRHRIAGQPLVSIIIPTRGGTDIESPAVRTLANCLRSIVEKSTYRNYEVVVVEDETSPDTTRALLAGVPHHVVPYSAAGPFNYAHKINAAVASSRGSHLVLFNDDIEVVTPEWLEAMLEFSQQEAIGAVGARLVYPDGRLQHVGVVLGVSGMAAHALHSAPGTTAGHGASAWIVRNYSAVTAACMMTRREVFERMHGFDECFATDFNDTDYCLRIRSEGYRIVYTPYAELCHLESTSFGARMWNASDLNAMRQRWADVCANDPYYNPNLSRDDPDYRVRV